MTGDVTKSGASSLCLGAQTAPRSSLSTDPDCVLQRDPGPFSGQVEDDGGITVWMSAPLQEREQQALRRAFE